MGGLDSFKKRARNAIKAAVLGASISAVPAAADAREMWAKPPIPAADGIQQAEKQFQGIEQRAKAITENAARTQDAIRSQFQKIEADAKAYADSLTPQELEEIGKQVEQDRKNKEK